MSKETVYCPPPYLSVLDSVWYGCPDECLWRYNEVVLESVFGDCCLNARISYQS